MASVTRVVSPVVFDRIDHHTKICRECRPLTTGVNMTDNAFWRFSLTLYRRDGAAEACLRLQDRHGADVNLVLFCLWRGLIFGPPDGATLRRAAAISEEWAARAVRPLRAIRRDLKSGIDGVEWRSVREQVKAIELAAEKAQQDALFALGGGDASATGPDAARDALRRYAEIAGLRLDLDGEETRLLLAHAEAVARQTLDDAGGSA